MTTYLVDTETTGIKDPIEPIELGWLKLDDSKDLQVVGDYRRRFKPSKPIELAAIGAHHIMDEDLVECSPSSVCILPADCTVVIGYNVDFDWKVLGSPKVRRIDVMSMVWKAWPAVGKITLAGALYHVDRAHARELLQNAHGALQDCQNTLIVLRAIAEAAGGFADWKAMWEYSEEARVPTHWPFGKHRDLEISKTPFDYLEWCLRQKDMDPYVLKAVRRAMNLIQEPDPESYP